MEKNKQKVVSSKKSNFSAKRTIGALSLALSLALTGCGVNETNNYMPGYNNGAAGIVMRRMGKFAENEHGEIYKIIPDPLHNGREISFKVDTQQVELDIRDEDTYMSVLNNVSDYTRMDDILENHANFDIVSLLEEYDIACKNSDIEKMNLLFSKIALMTIKAQAYDVLRMNHTQIKNMTLTNCDTPNKILLNIELNSVEHASDAVKQDENGVVHYYISGDRVNKIFDLILQAQASMLNTEELAEGMELVLECIVETPKYTYMRDEIVLSEDDLKTLASGQWVNYGVQDLAFANNEKIKKM